MKILFIGQCSYDLSFSLDDYPVQDSKVRASGFSASSGGPAANAAVLCARWGHESWFCGRAADDTDGRMLKGLLGGNGVNTAFFTLSDRYVTPVSSILVNTSNSKRTIINYREKAAGCEHFPFGTDGLADFDAMLTDGHDPAAAQALSLRPGIFAVLDAGSFRPETEELFSKVSWPVCSEVFTKTALGCDTIGPDNAKDVLNRLCEKLGNRNAAVTLGDKGVVWKEADEYCYLPACKVNAVDSSAAGDIFHGAFIASAAQDLGTGESMLRASAAAAISVTRMGSSASVPSLDETLDFISKQGRNSVRCL